MKRITAIILIISLLCGVAYSQEKTAQTQSVDPTKGKTEKVLYDKNKLTVIFYIDAKEETQKKFVQTSTLGMGNLINFGVFDVNKPKVAQKLRNILAQYKENGKAWNIVCVVGKDKESNVILGTDDIAQYLRRFVEHYSRPDLFKKPDLKYAKVETIADKFEDLSSVLYKIGTKFEEYKALAIEANEVLQSAVEEKSDDKTLVMLVMLIAFGALQIFGKLKSKVQNKRHVKLCQNMEKTYEEEKTEEKID